MYVAFQRKVQIHFADWSCGFFSGHLEHILHTHSTCIAVIVHQVQLQITPTKGKNDFCDVSLFWFLFWVAINSLATCCKFNFQCVPAVLELPSSASRLCEENITLAFETRLELRCWQDHVRCALEMLIDRANMCFVNSAFNVFSTWLSTRHKDKFCSCYFESM